MQISIRNIIPASLRLASGIALRQLRARKRQTGLTVMGISVGVMVLIAAVSLMDGLLSSFIDKIVDIAPHIVVSGEKVVPDVNEQLYKEGEGLYVNFIKNVERSDEEVIKNYKRAAAVISSDRNINVIAPVVSMNVIVKFGTLNEPVSIFGIEPSRQDLIEKFSLVMLRGEFRSLSNTPDGAMLGSVIAEDMGVHVGDKLTIVSNLGNTFNVVVTGVYSTGINDIDNNFYINLRLAQNIGGYNPDEVTQLYLRVKDLQLNTKSARTIEKEINYRAKTWEENAASVISLYRMISMMVYFLVFFVIIVAGFGVANVLITNVLERYREIAILKSIGFKRGEITRIYIFQAIMVGLSGAVLGCILGYIIIQVLGSIEVTASKTSALRSDRLQMGQSPYYFIFASLFALTVSLIASFAPARSAAKVSPAEILRGER